ncbi:MAG: dihydrofolate reductase family protein [Deltaproteobacteria bacterium]|nr:dihydrofolate reductase family protein [Deltaproteobacteria bacterium]
MRKVVLFIAASLDGYIAGPRGELDWLFSDQDYGYTPFMESVDTVVMGRASYQTAASFGKWPYGGKQCVVFSRQGGLKADPRVTVLGGDVPGWAAQVKAAPGKHIYLMGGGLLAGEFLAHNLLDEIRLFIHPVLLGGGVPLFPAGFPASHWTPSPPGLFASGLVRLGYQLREASPGA